MAADRRYVCLLLKGGQGTSLERFHALAEACGRFTPTIAVRGSEAIFLEIGGSRRIFSEETVRRRLVALARRFEWECAISVADTVPLAWCGAQYPRFGASGDFTELPLCALEDLLSPFQRDPEIQKKLNRMTGRLEALGIQTVSGFLALPPAALTTRFGQEAMVLWSLARGQREVPWPAFSFPKNVIEATVIDSEEALEPLLFVLRGLVDRAMARLRGRAERAEVVNVIFKMEQWSTLKNRERGFEIILSLPQGSVAGLLPIIKERLSFELSSLPLAAPVCEVRFEVTRVVPGAGAQRDFFDRREEEGEAHDALVGRLSCELGKERVFHALPVERYLPEMAWVPSTTTPKRAQPTQKSGVGLRTPQEPRCPSRLLKKPLRLRRLGSLLSNSEGERWEIRSWKGPERMTGEWWSPEGGFARDYYLILTENNEKLWVYLDRSHDEEALYLHGYFD